MKDFSRCVGLKKEKFEIVSRIRDKTGRNKKYILDAVIRWHRDNVEGVVVAKKKKFFFGGLSEYLTVAVSEDSYEYIMDNSSVGNIPIVRIMDQIMEDAINEGFFGSGKNFER